MVAFPKEALLLRGKSWAAVSLGEKRNRKFEDEQVLEA